MKRILDIDLVYMQFECPICHKTMDICSIDEILTTGTPICTDCDEELEFLECYIEE